MLPQIHASHSVRAVVILFLTSTSSLIRSHPTAVSSTAELSLLGKKKKKKKEYPQHTYLPFGKELTRVRHRGGK